MYISKEKIAKARNLDLLTYLRCYDPGELVKVSGNIYTTKTHDSLKISNGKWYWWSRGVGGKSALDYLVIVKGVSFLDAATYILNLTQGSYISRPSHVEKGSELAKLSIPKGKKTFELITQYLEERGIASEVITHCIDNGLIYESVYGEPVFLGFNTDGEVKYASCRSCDDSRNMRDCRGSKKDYSFRLGTGNKETVHVFEGAIDALSYATLLQMEGTSWKSADLLSLDGVAFGKKDGEFMIPKALKNYLDGNKSVKKICLHLDNDDAGRTAARIINESLCKHYDVRLLFPPIGKDYNEYLQIKLGKERNNGERRNIESASSEAGRSR